MTSKNVSTNTKYCKAHAKTIGSKPTRRTRLCRYFAQGGCFRHHRICWFLHDKQQINKKTAKCNYFQQGRCKFSDEQCWWSHDTTDAKDDTRKVAPTETTQATTAWGNHEQQSGNNPSNYRVGQPRATTAWGNHEENQQKKKCCTSSKVTFGTQTEQITSNNEGTQTNFEEIRTTNNAEVQTDSPQSSCREVQTEINEMVTTEAREKRENSTKIEEKLEATAPQTANYTGSMNEAESEEKSDDNQDEEESKYPAQKWPSKSILREIPFFDEAIHLDTFLDKIECIAKKAGIDHNGMKQLLTDRTRGGVKVTLEHQINMGKSFKEICSILKRFSNVGYYG